MSKRMMILIHFNTWHADPKTKRAWTKQWIDDRVAVFMKYTLRSLQAQTNQDFLTAVLYADETEPLIQQALSAYAELPSNVQFVPFSKTRDVIYHYIAGSEDFYLTMLGSDDMYHRTMIQQLYDAKPRPNTEVIINQLGYCYDQTSHRIAVWRHESPPFHTYVYKTADYLKGKRYQVVGGHLGAIKLKHETIADRYNYMVVIHGSNVSTRFSGTDVIDDADQVNEVLLQYMVALP